MKRKKKRNHEEEVFGRDTRYWSGLLILKLTSAGLGEEGAKPWWGDAPIMAALLFCTSDSEATINNHNRHCIFGGKRLIYHLGPISILQSSTGTCAGGLAIKFCGGMGSCTTVKMTKINHNQSLSKCPGSCEASIDYTAPK